MRMFYSVVESLHKHLHGWSHSVDHFLMWIIICEQAISRRCRLY